jgi:hypothetical protein
MWAAVSSEMSASTHIPTVSEPKDQLLSSVTYSIKYDQISQLTLGTAHLKVGVYYRVNGAEVAPENLNVFLTDKSNDRLQWICFAYDQR